MSAEDDASLYKDSCIQPLTVRRYSGTGSGRTKTDYDCLGNARLYSAKELIGAVIQGDQLVVITADSLTDAGFPFPLLTSDKVLVDGRELTIIVPGTRKALDGTLIAYGITARG